VFLLNFVTFFVLRFILFKNIDINIYQLGPSWSWSYGS